VTLNMPRRILGQGLEVSALGLGCMGMSWAYGKTDDDEAIRVIHRALGLGVNFLDTAEIYGPHTNERLVGRALEGRREGVVIATKFGFRYNAEGKTTGVDSRPENVRKVCDESLRRLGIDVIDLYYQHRVDPTVPIEETVGAMAELVQKGKVRHLGLSECSAATLRRAHAVHPIAALQSEYSLWERGVEAEVLPTCRELSIGFVPYSPLGRGFLTGRMTTTETLAADDFRRRSPRFQGEHFERNQRIVEIVRKVAAEVQATPAQVALAWLLAQGKDIVPIPGTKRMQYLEENLSAVHVRLSPQAMAELNEVARVTSGERYNPEALKMVGL
jgi:aryl-alcohol dehydrogenase-like predicted oxidoreductase